MARKEKKLWAGRSSSVRLARRFDETTKQILVGSERKIHGLETVDEQIQIGTLEHARNVTMVIDFGQDNLAESR